MSTNFPDFSLTTWMSDRNLVDMQSFNDYTVSQLLEDLGIAGFTDLHTCSVLNPGSFGKFWGCSNNASKFVVYKRFAHF